ncbi:MAG: MFS transporter [Acidobacteriota bacterium]|nr:MAG: MFS transporter [Acidobacteriota bacterium]
MPAGEERESEKPQNLLLKTFQAFRYRDFRLLWFGASTSTTGSWMQLTAQSWVVLQLTNSAFYLGLVGFLGQLPIILFTLLGGVFADRFDRRKLLLGSQYIQTAVAIILTILVLLDQIAIWHFLVLVFVAGCGQAFGGPAYQALIPGLVKREDVPNAIALNSIQFNLARMIGPVLAGLAFASLGAAFCFGANAVSFLAVIVSLLLIRATFIPPKTTETVLVQIKQGFRYIRGQGEIWKLTVLGFISTFCGVPLLTLLPVFARDVFDLQATGYSIMMAISGAGSITGALLYAMISNRLQQGKFALWVQLIFSVLLCLFALSPNLILSCVLLFLSGGCLISLFASITSLVQLATAEEMRGRIMSIFMLAFRGGMPLGDLTAGFLASRISPSVALIALSLVLASVASGFLLSGSGVKKL